VGDDGKRGLPSEATRAGDGEEVQQWDVPM
jgi:hypothetical protein